MWILWSTLAGLAFYLELVYHFSGFGLQAFNPVFAVLLIVAWAGVWSLFIGILKGVVKKICYYFALWLPVIWTGAQLVYLRIFKQPLLWAAMIHGGGDALTNYWREALAGILSTLPFIVLLALPAVLLPLIFKRKKYELPQFSSLQVLRTLVIIFAGAAGSFVMMAIGESAEFDYYEEYHEFYDPLTVAEELGVLPTLQGDITVHIRRVVEKLFPRRSSQGSGYVPAASREAAPVGDDLTTPAAGLDSAVQAPVNVVEEAAVNEAEGETVIRSQQFNIDFELLHQLADNDHQAWLVDYMEDQVPVTTNEYTGLFEGYNLIFLTAEGFSTYAIDEELTPTLYRMVNSGFVFENYYVPLWQTSTSDGEYINMTGLIPDRQFSMRESADNYLPYAMPGFFAGEGVVSRAYHNSTLSYYQRHLTHPNFGYDFKASRLGNLSEEEWGDKVFVMEEPGQWPASDYNMMVATLPEYVNDERFCVYYLTVSGHMNYDFKGNAMSAKNRDAVEGLALSEGAQAYLACNIELDKAMEYLLKQLEAAGQLERTVICLSADHYPYAMPVAQYEELAGRSLSAGKDMFRNSLILWNAGMEEEPVYVDKACGSMDILPTLLNLFGFEYDSRMYAGRDIFSDVEGLVIFNNRDFVTDSVVFIEKGDIAVWMKDAEGNDIVPDEEKEAYLAMMRQEVKNRYNFSAYILQEDYYADVAQAIVDTEATQ